MAPPRPTKSAVKDEATESESVIETSPEERTDAPGGRTWVDFVNRDREAEGKAKAKE